MKNLFLLIPVLVLSALGFAQGGKQITTQNLVWYCYTNTLQFSDKCYLVTELHERHFIDPFAQLQMATRTHFHYTLAGGWEAAAGLCVFLSKSSNPLASEVTIPEARYNIEFSQKQKLPKLTLDHRYQLEARTFQNTNATRTELEDGFYFGNFRFRYRFQAVIPIFKLKNNKSIKLKLNDEIMFNFGKNIVYNSFDQNRIYAAINADLTKSISLELGYLNSFQKRTTAGDFYDRNILRVTLFHKINLTKEKNVN